MKEKYEFTIRYDKKVNGNPVFVDIPSRDNNQYLFDIDNKVKLSIKREDVGYVIDIYDEHDNFLTTATVWDVDLENEEVKE